jgi:YbbR domain-containing protein
MNEKRYHIVIASIIFAGLMWFSINMGYEYVIVRHVPVVLEGMKPGKALKYPVPKTVAIRFSGHGWELATMLVAGDMKYYVDVSNLSSERFLVTKHDLPEHIKTLLTVEPVDIKPETLMLALDELREKRVPVAQRINPQFREGFGQVGPIRVTPESVTVLGTADLVKEITVWHVARRLYHDLRTPVDEEVPLEETGTISIAVEPTTVRLHIDVQQFAEKTFPGIPLSAPGTPLNREVIFIPPKVDVIVRGGIEQLAKISPNDIQAAVMYQTLTLDSSGIVVPTVSVPPGVQVIQRTPERFQFFIRKKL